MQRAPLGSGIHFFFKDPVANIASKGIVLNKNHENIYLFFCRLEAHADDFLEELKKEVPGDG
jgi:hypothetical protein